MLPAPSGHRALELLADAGRDGVAEGLMLANGITIKTMVALVRAGLATATPQRVRAGGRSRRCGLPTRGRSGSVSV